MPERMMNHEIIDSVGIEIEFSNLDRKSYNLQLSMREKNLEEYRLEHDASCESLKEFFADTDIPIEIEDEKDLQTLAPIVRRAVIGGEVISPIRHSGAQNWVQEIYNLVEILKQHGEDETSQRDSFHVHVNVSQSIPLFAIQNLLRSTMTLEAILFRLGGMGRVNRGQENNYCFERPFLGNGPPVIKQKWGNNRVSNIPICDPEKMLTAESKEQFFGYYGDSARLAAHNVKYVTQRYMCVNFYPILTQGSFEFRTANKTLNSDYIIAWTNLCKAIVDKSFMTRDIKEFEDIRRPLHENREISVEEFLASLEYFPKLDNDTIEVLLDIWDKSPTPMFDNVWRYTHLREPTTFHQRDYAPDTLTDIEIAPPTFIDIHHLQQIENENRRLRFGDGLGPVARLHFPEFRAERPPIPSVQTSEEGILQPINEINMHAVERNYHVNYNTDIYDITFWRTQEDNEVNTLYIVIYDQENDEEWSRNIRGINWFNLNQFVMDLYDGFTIDECRYQ